jgi:ectoine hydroxylase-related dioxygenase (phytanoyl-CoA dioxygenase family)
MEVARICSLILGCEARPSYSINFTFGSTQTLHQDTAVFCVWPMNYLVGAWLACEDIHPDSGPLVYYPGSHRENLFPDFDNYPQTNLKTTPRMDDYNRYLDEVSRRYERKTFIARKGEWFLWHGMMIHGGAAINNKTLTRRSYVCHYIPPGMNKEAEIVGPFNW